MPLPIEDQHRQKLQSVIDAFAAVGIELPSTSAVWADPPMVCTRATGYRNRLRLRMSEGTPVFFNPHKERDCEVLTPALRTAIARLRRELPKAVARDVVHLEVRQADADGIPGVHLVGADQRSVSVELPGWTTDMQRSMLTEDVYAWTPVSSFRQVHDETARSLVETIAKGAKQRRARTFLDLYAGVGNHALVLAKRGLSGVAIEVDARAVNAMMRSIAEQRLTALSARCDDVLSHLRSEAHTRPFDLVVANPPRAGLKAAADPIAALRAPNLALICCDPRSLARDIASLTAGGYALREIQCFEMFPHTAHVETIAWLMLARE